MNNHSLSYLPQTRKERDWFLLRYTEAVLEGDLATQETMESVAANDPELEDAIWDILQTVGAEVEAELQVAGVMMAEREQEFFQDLLDSYFPGRRLERPSDAAVFQSESELPPLTVGEVATQLRASVQTEGLPLTARAPERQAVLQEILRLEQSKELLPTQLNKKSVRTLLNRIRGNLQRAGLLADWLDQRFQEAAMHLLAHRNTTTLAAARRVHSVAPTRVREATSPEPEENQTDPETIDETQTLEKENETDARTNSDGERHAGT